jgi:hypothetical protein
MWAASRAAFVGMAPDCKIEEARFTAASETSSGELDENRHSLLGRFGISGTGFINRELGNAQIECGTSSPPPFPGDLLVSGNDQVPARPRSQIAGNRRFDVNALGHDAAILFIPAARSTVCG